MDASAAAPVPHLASKVVDPRRHNRLHTLPQMLVMALIAILCGSDGWDGIAEFCEVREQWFKDFLSLPYGIPSHDTFGRVFGRLDPPQLEEMLRKWMEALNIASGGTFVTVAPHHWQHDLPLGFSTRDRRRHESLFEGWQRIGPAADLE